MKHLKSLCFLLLFLTVSSEDLFEEDEDLTDFNFASDNTESPDEEVPPVASNSSELFDNDVDYDDQDESSQPGPLQAQLSLREATVRQVVVNSMKSKEMKDNMAKVLPILRVMTPDQKLALATLVTTQVLTPPESKGLSIDEVSTLFGNNPNTTAELMLPISLDIANLFRRSARNEKGPTAEELRAPPFRKHYRGPGVYRRNIIERPAHNNKFLTFRKPTKVQANKEPINCELFTASICLKSHDYPTDQILSSIRRNKHTMNALLTDVKSLPADDSAQTNPEVNNSDNENPEESNEVRRTGTESGFMCPSVVRYARPQKARSTGGQWKFIVNTADHTQTLRLERCTKAGDTCTYLTDNFKSRCVQVFNYHRLLTWDQTNGLHMDIFKVPTCCSCHIDSYKVPYPPLYDNHASTSEAFPGDEIEPSSTTDETFESFQNSIIKQNKHNHLRKDAPLFEDFHHGESTKIRQTVERPGLPKFLEAPKPQQNYSYKPNFNHKRSNTPKPFSGGRKPIRPLRRRPPTKPVRDLAQSESNYGAFTTDVPTTSTIVANTKKINYNYHPIIDFFKPEPIESRMDVTFADSDWKPVTSMLMNTERNLRRR